MDKNINFKNREELLNENGWVKADAGYCRTKNYNDLYELHVRKRRLKDVLENRKNDTNFDFFCNKKSNATNLAKAENPVNKRAREVLVGKVSNTTMGTQSDNLTPNDTLPPLSHFSEFDCLKTFCDGNADSLVIAFDTEYYYNNGCQTGKRNMLSYQFACVYNNYLYEFIFTRGNNRDTFVMNVELCIGRILDELEYSSIDKRKVRKYKCIINADTKEEKLFLNKNEAEQNSVGKYDDGKNVHIEYNYPSNIYNNVTLLCHAAKFDVTGFSDSYTDKHDIVACCKDIGGGFVTIYPIKKQIASTKSIYNKNGNIHVYPVSLSISDTMCHTVKDKAKLENLGEVVNFPKIYVEPFYKAHMNLFFIENIVNFFEYASNDCIVTLMYAASLYGFNKKIPVTIISKGSDIFKRKLSDLLDCENNEEFEYKYRGHKKEKHGKNVDKNNGKSVYYESSSYEAVNSAALIVQDFCSYSFHGGYNICISPGCYSGLTFDYDLKNAYLLTLSLVLMIDWYNPIKDDIVERKLTLDDFMEDGKLNPLKMIVAYVTFDFPEDCSFPSIQIQDNGNPVYPLSSNGCEGVYACGPELYLALKLGANVYVKRGYILNTDIEDNKRYALRDVIKMFVNDRAKAKDLYGDDCLEQYILKLVGNSIYGKISQDVISKSHWDNYKKSMEDIGCSKITNPVVACFTTAIVRTVLIATITQVKESGYTSYSVTTDGFISDVPLDVLESFDLFGFREKLESARLFLTNGTDKKIWEIKHVQDDLLNFSTRGNVSLHSINENPIIFNNKRYAGVCAHLNMKSGYEPDSYADRKWLYKAVLSRTSKIEFEDTSYTSLKEMQLGKAESFLAFRNNEHRSADFDMKRKPVKDSITSVLKEVDGSKFEIVNFNTEPFKDINEFRKYRETKNKVECLRTEEDFESFYLKLNTGIFKTKGSDIDRQIIMTCIRMHRAGQCIIPALNSLKSDARLKWINKHNDSKKLFTLNDWKNAGRNDRFINVLPESLVKDKLVEMVNDTNLDEYLKI